MNKKLTSVLSGVLLGITGMMNGQTWTGATRDGTGSYSSAIVTDMDEYFNTSSYVVGYFAGSYLALGTTTLTNNTVYSNGYLCKYNSSGVPSWAVQAVGNGSLSSDKSIQFRKVMGYGDAFGGGAIIYGTYQASSITFKSTDATTATVSGGTGFLVNYNSSGVVKWAVPFTGTVNDFAWNTNTFYTIGQSTLTASPAVAVKSFSMSNGASAGLNLQSTTLTSIGRGIGVDGSGNVYFLVEAPQAFHMPGSPTFPVASTAAIILKYDASGSYVWSRQLDGVGAGNTYGTDLDVDGTGVYISGSYEGGSTYMDYPNTSGYVLSNSGGKDGYIAKYDQSTGNILWANKIGGAGDDVPVEMSVTSGTSLLVVNNYPTNSVSFAGTCSTETYSSTTSGTDNRWYLASYNSTGGITWSAAPTLAVQNSVPVGIKGTTIAYMAGPLTSIINFGSLSVQHGGGSGFDQATIFFAKAQKNTCLTGQVTGIEEQDASMRSMYPNPTTGMLNFTLKPEDRNVSIVITDQLGRTVLTADHLESKQGQLNLEALPAGMYFYNVKTDDGAYQGRIIRE